MQPQTLTEIVFAAANVLGLFGSALLGNAKRAGWILAGFGSLLTIFAGLRLGLWSGVVFGAVHFLNNARGYVAWSRRAKLPLFQFRPTRLMTFMEVCLSRKTRL